MKSTINQYQFTEAFRVMRPDNFSYTGLLALFDWFEQFEDDTGTEIELDVIAICCDFSEYVDLAEFQRDFNAEDYPDIESIQEYTTVIPVGPYVPSLGETARGFIIQSF